MYVVRDVFRCKPGKAKELVERFRKTIPELERDDNFTNIRLMVDAVAEYWTVVLEADCPSLAHFEKHLREFGTRPYVREALEGYMDLVEGGKREIFRLV
jgi:hypothetical protein